MSTLCQIDADKPGNLDLILIHRDHFYSGALEHPIKFAPTGLTLGTLR